MPSGAFGGLDRLRSLSINSEHSSFLAVEAGGLSGLPNLEDLNLGGNYLRSLPSGELCNLPRLRTLNVSGNEIASLSQLGLGGRGGECMERLQVLDLSHNEISELKGGEAAIRSDSLMELVLSSNYISEVHEAALAGLSRLELLDLSDNEIRDIPFGALRGYPSLERLYLSNNQIGHISRDALADLPSLAELDLSRNKLIADAMEVRLGTRVERIEELSHFVTRVTFSNSLLLCESSLLQKVRVKLECNSDFHDSNQKI